MSLIWRGKVCFHNHVRVFETSFVLSLVWIKFFVNEVRDNSIALEYKLVKKNREYFEENFSW